MSKLENNDSIVVAKGKYVFVVSGALDLQMEISNEEGFVTLSDGVISEATDFILSLPQCAIKVINAGANSLIFSAVE
tara:strand:- start:186 stop:416 length:231 start_codon:yes stop_codon:yes gene_type:complete